MRYVCLVVRFPWLFIVTPLLLASTLLSIIIYISDLPLFQDPKKGFETRNTLISNRILAYKQLIKKSFGFKDYLNNYALRNNGKIHDTFMGDNSMDGDDDYNAKDYVEFGSASGIINNGSQNFSKSYFCGKPDEGYSKFVYESSKGRSLFNIYDLRSICIFEESLLQTHSNSFNKFCDKDINGIFCCRSFSLPNYIAFHAGKLSCKDISEDDLLLFKNLIVKCSSNSTEVLLHSKKIPDEDCIFQHCPRCLNYTDMINDAVSYLMDDSFYKNTQEWHLKNIQTFLPLSRGITSKEFYYDIEKKDLASENFSIVAMDFGLKQEIFDDHLFHDTYWSLCGLVCILCLLLFYTGSLLITVGTLLQILTSLIFTYLTYRHIFGLTFFPFLNMLAIVILISTGIDNTFIIYHIWCQLKLHNQQSSSIDAVLEQTITHAFKSIFVTSATTSVALLAGFVSNIIVLKCFAVFSGTLLVFNFFVTILTMPSIIILHDKSSSNSNRLKAKLGLVCSRIDEWCGNLFQACVCQLVLRFKWIWVCSFSFIGLISLFIVFVHPKLKLPSSNNFQLFIKSHPFEMYEMVYRDKFSYEKSEFSDYGMPLRFVWGLDINVEASSVDPNNDGKMVIDETFDISTTSSQQFLYNFCRKVRKLEYFKPKPGLKLSNCFIEKFKSMMSRSCKDLYKNDVRPCCIQSKFPYSKEVFFKCLNNFLPEIAYNHLFEDYKEAGLRFDGNYSKVLAVVLEFTSFQPHKPNYTDMQQLYNSLEGFMKTYIQNYAPSESANGYFLSDLMFYDFQYNLIVGTPTSLILSVAMAAIFGFITTRNIIITILTMFSISLSILTTIAVLVVNGWELGVFESMSISLAVGLSIDYAFHYGISYQHAQDESKQTKVIQTIRMSAPVALAAATTFFVGLFLMPSVVLVYRQLASFLMTVTTVSWLCSTLFYTSLLLIIGPQGAFGMLKCPKHNNCCLSCNTSEPNSRKPSKGTSSIVTDPPKSHETVELM